MRRRSNWIYSIRKTYRVLVHGIAALRAIAIIGAGIGRVSVRVGEGWYFDFNICLVEVRDRDRLLVIWLVIYSWW